MEENPYQSPLAEGRESGSGIRWAPLAMCAYLAAFTAWLGSLALCTIEPPGGWNYDPLTFLDAANVALLVAWIAIEACLFIDGRLGLQERECTSG